MLRAGHLANRRPLYALFLRRLRTALLAGGGALASAVAVTTPARQAAQPSTAQPTTQPAVAEHVH